MPVGSSELLRRVYADGVRAVGDRDDHDAGPAYDDRHHGTGLRATMGRP